VQSEMNIRLSSGPAGVLIPTKVSSCTLMFGGLWWEEDGYLYPLEEGR